MSRGGNLRRALGLVPRRGSEAKRVTSMLASLDDLGWQRSARARAPVTADGAPLPWFTYAAISWLGPRLRSADRVFEYGSGNSSLWFAARVSSVTTVEHDQAWADRLASQLPANVELRVRPDPGSDTIAPLDHTYITALSEEADGDFDVIVVDARARATCLEVAVPKLAATGLLVLDNADRPQFRPALDLLHEGGLGRIDFLGPVPGSGRLSVTSVFGRDLRRWLDVNAALPHVGY
jgi:hypothetical protein